MITRTEIEIMKLFVSSINDKFSINQIALRLKKPYPLIHRTIKKLLDRERLEIDNRKLISLNYKKDLSELSYIEELRTKERMNKEKSISLFIRDCLANIKQDFFIFLIFGSFVEKDKFNDLDIILVVDNKEIVDRTEKILNSLSSNFSFKIHSHIIDKESAYELFSKREQINILNESLNKHLIVFGAENYYRILANARR